MKNTSRVCGASQRVDSTKSTTRDRFPDRQGGGDYQSRCSCCGIRTRGAVPIDLCEICIAFSEYVVARRAANEAWRRYIDAGGKAR